ncbi:branched-chain-amino-acid transaminase [Candidatus Bathyarchaeota archaeon]|nr:branched-chain-amino-acid transaminase [Candidatus Bathyarchaeota archaeon]
MSGFHGAKYCWMNGEVMETKDALVSAMEPFHYGIFEGIRAYVEGDVLGEGDLNIFRWQAHVDRLRRSAVVCGLGVPYSDDELLEGIREIIKLNGYRRTTYIMPRIWPKAGAAMSRGIATDWHVVIPVWEMPTRLGEEAFTRERRYMISSWRRIAPDALPTQAKAWANYANSGLAGREAARLGFDNAIFLDNRGFVSEATGACLMTVRNGKVITPPVTASILESVTRDALLEFIPEDLGIPVEVRDITRVELYASDEVFTCGTGAEVTPITSVDDVRFGDEYPGPVTDEIAKHFMKVLAGSVEARRGWLTPV